MSGFHSRRSERSEAAGAKAVKPGGSERLQRAEGAARAREVKEPRVNSSVKQGSMWSIKAYLKGY